MDFDSEVLRFAAQSNERIEQMFNDYFDELAAIGIKTPKDSGVFSFEKDVPPQYREKVDQLTKSFQERLYKEIHAGVDVAYGISLAKHTALLSALFPEGLNVHQPRRKDAREAFIRQRTKPTGRLSLSDRVWNYANQGKAEVEAAMSLAIEDGVVQGKTAAELGRSLRKYLNDPDRMYRRYHTTITLADGSKKDVVTWRKRVIGPDGKVHFVETEIDKPGQGVYISARANAERCSRSEINGAYRYADYERWNDEEFVIGIKISLSNNHTILEEKKVGKKHIKTPVPFHDICDDLAGNYPKTFKWAGWHPQCRCHATAITASKEDRKQWLAEGCPPGFFDDKYIKDAPPQMVKWLNENKDKVQRAKSLPFWIQDNFDVKRRSVQPKEMEVIEQKVYKAEVTQNSTMRELYKYSPSSLDMSKQTERTSTSVVDVMSDYLDKKTAEKLSNIKLFDEEVRNKIADISIDNSTIGKLIALGTPMASRAETIAKRKELAEWMKTSDLFVSKSVLFDEESGTLFAMHKGHKLDKWKNEYFGNTISSNRLELELSDILLGGMKSGRCVIMLNESVVVGNDMCAALDLFVDGVFTDIKSVTQHDASVINAMSTKSHQIGGFTRSRKIKSDMLILYYHDKSMYDKEKLDSAIEKYKKSKVIQKHIRHLCVVTNDGSILVVDI